jgi:hypothetical protein
MHVRRHLGPLVSDSSSRWIELLETARTGWDLGALASHMRLFTARTCNIIDNFIVSDPCSNGFGEKLGNCAGDFLRGIV